LINITIGEPDGLPEFDIMYQYCRESSGCRQHFGIKETENEHERSQFFLHMDYIRRIKFSQKNDSILEEWLTHPITLHILHHLSICGANQVFKDGTCICLENKICELPNSHERSIDSLSLYIFIVFICLWCLYVIVDMGYRVRETYFIVKSNMTEPTPPLQYGIKKNIL